MRFTPHFVVGVALTLLGSALLLGRLGIVAAAPLLSYWPVMLMLFGGAGYARLP